MAGHGAVPPVGGAPPPPAVPPPVIAGGGGVLPGVPPAGPPQPVTYAARLRDAQNDVYNGHYATLYEEQSTVPLGNAVAPPNHGTLFNRALSASQHAASVVYVVLVEVGGGHLIRTLTNLSRYQDAPGVARSQYDGRVFATMGDVERTATGFTHMTTVEVPDNIFTLSNRVRAPVAGEVAGQLAALAAGTVSLGPYAAGDPNTEEIRTRYALPLPGPLGAIVMGRDLTPREFYAEVVGHIEQTAGLLPDCEHIRTWSITTLTLNDNNVVTSGRPDLTVVDARQPLLNQRYSLITRDLPGLRPGHGDPLNLIAMGIGRMTAETRQARVYNEQVQAEAVREKEAGDRWKGRELLALIHDCEVPDETYLPEVYTRLARINKKTTSDATAINNELKDVAMRDTSFVSNPPVLSSKVCRRGIELEWYSEDKEDLDGGINPWHTVYISRAQQTVQQRFAQTANLVHTAGSVSLADAINLEALEDAGTEVPTTPRQLWITLGGYQVVLDTFKGQNHRISRELRRSLILYRQRENELADTLESRPQYVPLILQWFHLQLREFYIAKRASPPGAPLPPVPDLATIWRQILVDSWNPPQLPLALQAPPLAPAPAPAPAPARPGVPQAAAEEAAAAAAAAQARRGRLVAHENDAEICARAGSGWVSRTVKRDLAAEWPKMDDEVTLICLPWWTKGGCYTNCACAAAHVAALTTAERSRLLQFLDTHFAQYRN